MTGISGFIRRRRNGVSFALLLIFCLILMLLSNRNLVIKPRQVGHTLLSAFQISFQALSHWFTNTWNAIGELKKLRGELEAARERLLEYERLSRDLSALRRENEALKHQLGFSKTLIHKRIPAEVIARDPGNQFSTLIISKGARHGVKQGQPVVAFQRGLQGLVGKVVLVGLSTSIIKPITDPASYVAARLQETRYDGLVGGRQARGNGLLMQYVKKLAMEDIQYGDLVVTSGMGQLYPEGIHIGRVRAIQARGYEASLELEIEPIVDFSRLEYLFVLSTDE